MACDSYQWWVSEVVKSTNFKEDLLMKYSLGKTFRNTRVATGVILVSVMQATDGHVLEGDVMR